MTCRPPDDSCLLPAVKALGVSVTAARAALRRLKRKTFIADRIAAST